MASEIQSEFSIDEIAPETRSVCSPCSDNGDYSAAGHYCVDCEIYLCYKCLKCHNRIPATKSHQVNDVESNGHGAKTKPMEQPKNEQPESMKCYVHHGKIIDLYCTDHEELCCRTCTLFKHRACEVEDIAVIARNFKSSHKVKQCKESLSNILLDLNQEIDTRMKNLTNFEQDKMEMLERVDTHEKEVIAMVTDLAEMSRKEIRDTHEDHKTVINSEVQVLKAVVDSTAKCFDKITQTNDDQLFRNVATSKLLMKESEQLLQAMSSGWRKKEVEFMLDNEIKTTFRKKTSFGVIEKYPIQNYEARLYRRSNLSKYVNEVDVCTLESGDIFITEKHSNLLKRYDSELKFKESIDTAKKPVAVCHVSANEVAVRSYGGQVQIISVDESMKVETLFEVEARGFGWTYDATDEEFFVCEGSKISVCSKTGSKLRTHETTTDGEQLFSDCMQIAIDTETKSMYVKDTRKSLIVLYRSGNIKSRFTDIDVNGSWAFCKLPGDIYLVSDIQSQKIVQFRHNYEFATTLIENVIARCLVYDRVNNRLIVVGNMVIAYSLSATRYSDFL